MKTDAEWYARARELGLDEHLFKIVQLGREMAVEAADARSEEIALKIDTSTGHWPSPASGIRSMNVATAVALARSTTTKPKTREQVLEEALKVAHQQAVQLQRFEEAATFRRALDWKPT